MDILRPTYSIPETYHGRHTWDSENLYYSHNYQIQNFYSSLHSEEQYTLEKINRPTFVKTNTLKKILLKICQQRVRYIYNDNIKLSSQSKFSTIYLKSIN